jgi:hypothetical protein
LPLYEKNGIVNGNGLSPFAVKMDTPNNLRKLLITFCEQWPKCNRQDLSNSADDSLDIGEEDEVVELDDEDDGAVEIGAGSIPADVLNDMIAELNAAEEEGSDDENPVVSSTDGKEKEDDLYESDKADLLFANRNSWKAYDELKLML